MGHPSAHNGAIAAQHAQQEIANNNQQIDTTSQPNTNAVHQFVNQAPEIHQQHDQASVASAPSHHNRNSMPEAIVVPINHNANEAATSGAAINSEAKKDDTMQSQTNAPQSTANQTTNETNIQANTDLQLRKPMQLFGKGRPLSHVYLKEYHAIRMQDDLRRTKVE